jgi:hypothetical protein
VIDDPLGNLFGNAAAGFTHWIASLTIMTFNTKTLSPYDEKNNSQTRSLVESRSNKINTDIDGYKACSLYWHLERYLRAHVLTMAREVYETPPNTGSPATKREATRYATATLGSNQESGVFHPCFAVC